MKKMDDIIAVFRGALKVVAFLALTFFLLPVAVIYKRLYPQQPFKIPCLYHRLLLRLLGISLRVYGEQATASPILFVANHTSYLDVPVLGSLLTASFVAKAEVAGWPLFGLLARIQNTVFVERRSTRAAEQRTLLQSQLIKQQNIILFPEGTSSDGLRVLPFKSTLFGIVEDSAGDAAITIQPVSITCTELDGFFLLREERPLYAWYGDMTLPPHLWNVFKNGRFTVEVIFHPPLTATNGSNRKLLAATCQDIVAKGIEKSLMQHDPEPIGREEPSSPLAVFPE